MRILRYLIPIFLILTIFLIGFKEYEKIKASDFQILNVEMFYPGRRTREARQDGAPRRGSGGGGGHG